VPLLEDLRELEKKMKLVFTNVSSGVEWLGVVVS